MSNKWGKKGLHSSSANDCGKNGSTRAAGCAQLEVKIEGHSASLGSAAWFKKFAESTPENASAIQQVQPEKSTHALQGGPNGSEGRLCSCRKAKSHLNSATGQSRSSFPRLKQPPREEGSFAGSVQVQVQPHICQQAGRQPTSLLLHLLISSLLEYLLSLSSSPRLRFLRCR